MKKKLILTISILLVALSALLAHTGLNSDPVCSQCGEDITKNDSEYTIVETTINGIKIYQYLYLCANCGCEVKIGIPTK